MKKNIALFVVAAPLVAAFLVAGDGAPSQVQTKTVDGVVHIMNPDKPLNGTVKLEVERIRTIDPYSRPEVEYGLNEWVRGRGGEVILYDSARVSVHRWSSKDEYIGRISGPGQGPAEFPSQAGIHVCFVGDEIWIWSVVALKMGRFAKDGVFIDSRNVRNRLVAVLDEYRALALDMKPGPKTEPVLRMVYFNSGIATPDRTADLLGPAMVGSIRRSDGRGGFADPWGTPQYVWAYLPALGIIATALNTEYRIQIRDLDGMLVRVIERPYERISLTRKDLDAMYGDLLRKSDMGWLKDAYPDRYVAFRRIVDLPGGHLGVYRISGRQKYEIDVFDREGRFLYSLIPPEGINLDRADYFERGLFLMESEGDSSVYREYRVKNLPAVFK